MNYDMKKNTENTQESSHKPVLKVIMIGGTEQVNKNMTVYEYGDEIVVVDCGIGFPDIFDMPGVDILIPDFLLQPHSLSLCSRLRPHHPRAS